LQEFVHRTNYSCKEIPVGKYLQVLGLQTFSPHSRTTSATNSTGHITAGITIPVGLYLSVFTCGEKAYIAKQKEEAWIGQFNMRLSV
jgi:hypothetical protein